MLEANEIRQAEVQDGEKEVKPILMKVTVFLPGLDCRTHTTDLEEIQEDDDGVTFPIVSFIDSETRKLELYAGFPFHIESVDPVPSPND